MGKIVVIEGTDFSGKSTQYDLLKKRLFESNISVGSDSFPNYNSPTCYFVTSYLQGKYGENANNINPKLASTFYAMDRFGSFMERDWGRIYRENGNILFARYITSNILHQASKYKTWEEKKEFITWLYNFETELLGLPKEDKVFLLDMPPEAGKKLKEQRLKEQHGLTSSGGEVDIHENNENYLLNSYNTAKEVAKFFNWEVVSCLDNSGKLRTIEDINEELYLKIKDIFM